MPYATRGDQTLRATGRVFPCYFLRDVRDPVSDFPDFGGGLIPTDWSFFGGHAAGSEMASRSSNPNRRPCVLTQHLLLFVTSEFLLGIYFLPVAVVLSGGVKQVTTLP